MVDDELYLFSGVLSSGASFRHVLVYIYLLVTLDNVQISLSDTPSTCSLSTPVHIYSVMTFLLTFQCRNQVNCNAGVYSSGIAEVEVAPQSAWRTVFHESRPMGQMN